MEWFHKREELWHNPYKDQIYFVYPACKCHLYSYIISSGPRFEQSFSIDFGSRREFREYMKSYGRHRL